MRERITIKDIAREAGVHYSTVSLALSSSPRLPAATRKHLQKLAKQMGYSPDAAMKALSAYRSAKRPHPVSSGLAYLTDMPRDNRFGRAVLAKAQEQAERLGYNLIEFNLSDSDTSLDHFESVWWHMGLRGVLIGPCQNPGTKLPGSWDRWVVVAYGYSVTEPAFNRAVEAHFLNMTRHLEELRLHGYQRIGLHLPGHLSERTFGLLHAAYLLDQHNSRSAPIPLLTTDLKPADLARFDRWRKKWKPDCIIGLPEIYRHLLDSGVNIPDTLGFSLLSWKEFKPPCAGWDMRAEALAGHSISFLVSLIHEQVLGIPEIPRIFMIPGKFHEGPTLRSQ